MKPKYLVRVYQIEEDGSLNSLIDNDVHGVFISSVFYNDKNEIAVRVDATNACYGVWNPDVHVRALQEQSTFLRDGVTNELDDFLEAGMRAFGGDLTETARKEE